MQNLVNLSITFTKLWKINMTFCIKICGVLHSEVSIKARWPKICKKSVCFIYIHVNIFTSAETETDVCDLVCGARGSGFDPVLHPYDFRVWLSPASKSVNRNVQAM